MSSLDRECYVRLAAGVDAAIGAYDDDGPVLHGIGVDEALGTGHPFDVTTWEVGPVEITDEGGAVIFSEPSAEFPESWGAQARTIVAQKYFYGDHGQGFRETSLKQLLLRVTARIALWAMARRTFRTGADARNFYHSLLAIQLRQEFAFNSPIYFNVGIDIYEPMVSRENYMWDDFAGDVVECPDANKHPQVSACFIQSVRDNMMSIMALATSEAMIFKRGSGSGTDLSPLRSCREKLSGGGKPSGPLSFMRIYDAVAAVVKSGGKCLAAHQPVFTAGGIVTACDLAESGADFVVLSYSRRLGRVAAKSARAWRGDVKPVVRVTTDKGTFEVSFDHPFMLRTGEPARAGDLRPGMSLTPVSTSKHEYGYVRVGLHDGFKGKALLHQLVARDVMGWGLDGMIVHHENEIPTDCRPKNLRLKTQSDHASEHGRSRARRGCHVFQTRKFGRSGSDNPMAAGSPSAIARDHRCLMEIGYRVINAGGPVDNLHSMALFYRRNFNPHESDPRLARKVAAVFGTFDAFRSALADGNHRVVSVEPLGLQQTYSVEVIDDEPDDKRAWSEHNYAIAPIGTRDQYCKCAIVFNSRRAAKMQTLKCDHPDIIEFINAKADEERKAQAMIREGYEANFNGEAYSSVFFQNSNLSVRVTDEFMAKARYLNMTGYDTIARTTGEVVDTQSAPAVLELIAAQAHFCGDPGLQFEDTIQRWHTVPGHGPINSSNPCCFVRDTIVDTSSGRIAIGELARMSSAGETLPHVFAFDPVSDMPVLRRVVRAWRAGDVWEVVRVETDKGIILECTPDHPFLLHDGSYAGAGSLRPGTRLRKIGKAINKYRDNRRCINHKTTPAAPNGTVWLNRFIWEQLRGPIPDGYEVHHVNGDMTDDRIDNYELIESSDHRSLHSAGESNPRFIDAGCSLIVDTWDRIASEPVRDGRYGSGVTVGRWNRFVREHGLKGKVPLARGDGRIRGMSWDAFRSWVESVRDAANDRVASVRRITSGSPIPVFDMEVEGAHNFAVTSGDRVHSIVVHNSEYMHIDDSACNLASINAMQMMDEDLGVNYHYMRAVIDVMTVAMETVIDEGSYPTPEIALNSHRFRPLGGGYANVGAYVMALGLAYDSDEARSFVAAFTSLLTARMYRRSAELARLFGAFDGFAADRDNMLNVIDMHLDETKSLAIEGGGGPVVAAALQDWADAHAMGFHHGFRNSQATCIAPTGTIAFMMGCDTLGIEPEIALVRYKHLAGRGVLKLTSRVVRVALESLGYDATDRDKIIDHIKKYGTIQDIQYEGPDGLVVPSGLHSRHLPVFDCAFAPPARGVDPIGDRWVLAGEGRYISAAGHVDMMAAATPFVSGAISKTVNMPEHCTANDIRGIYVRAWETGCKAIAVYRDNSKGSQPITTAAPVPAARDRTVYDQLIDEYGFKKEDLDKSIAAAQAVGGNDALKAEGFTDDEIEYAFDRVGAPMIPRPPGPVRHKLPDTRESVTHKFSVEGHEGYVIVGLYEDKSPGEVFVSMAKNGSTVGGLLDSLGIMISLGLQYGVPLAKIVEKLANQRFEPRGITIDRDIPFATSIVDYIAKWLGCYFIPGYRDSVRPTRGDDTTPAASHGPAAMDTDMVPTSAPFAAEIHGKACPACGSIMVRQGPCYMCFSCGFTDGGCGG